MKKQLFLTFGCLIGLWVYGQRDHGGNTQKSIDFNKSIPQFIDPSVSKMHQVSQFGMTYYTGRANISIPIHTIKEGNITIPIALNYDTSGVKAAEQASNVGLNWSLSGTGSVIRAIKGVDDFAFVSGRLFQGGKTGFGVGWMNLNEENNFTYKNKDSEPDEYIVSAPGLRTSFVFSEDLNPISLSGVDVKIETEVGNIPEYKNYKLYKVKNPLFGDPIDLVYRSTLKDVRSINILNAQGLEYTFNIHDITQSVNLLDPPGSRMSWTRYISTKYQNEKVNIHHLKSIRDRATHREVIYKYDNYQRRNNDMIYSNAAIGYYLKGSFIANNLMNNMIMNPSVNRLKEIDFSKGKVVFTYGIDRKDWPDEKALTKIEIYNETGGKVKSVELEYDYFNTDSNINVQCDSEITECYRLKLTALKIKDRSSTESQKYTFEYNEGKGLPMRGFINTDYMGYFNKSKSKANQSSFPRLYYTLNKGINSVLPFRPSSYNSVVNSNGFSLAPNEHYAKLGILKKIIHPTGGINEFEYELNSFKFEGKTYYGAGLRVKKQIISDGNGQRIEKSYSYSDNKGTTGRFNGPFPVFGSAFSRIPVSSTRDPNYKGIFFSVYQFPKYGYQLFNKNFVGYSKVTVIEKGKHNVSKGKTIYELTNIEDYPIDYSKIYVYGGAICTNRINPPDDQMKLFDNFSNIDRHLIFSHENGNIPIRVYTPIYKLGKLKKMTQFDAYGNIVKEIETIYQSVNSKEYPYKVCYNPDEFTNFFGRGIPNISLYVKSFYDNYSFLKKREKITHRFNGRKIERETQNTYNKQSFLQSQTTANSKNQTIETTYQYAHDLNDQRLIDENRIAVPLKTTVRKDGKILSQQQTKYGSFGSLYLPKFVLAKKGSASLSETLDKKITYDRYDDKGNLLQYHTENGLTTSLLWDRTGEYPIAKVEGVAYNAISSYQSHPEDLRAALPKARVTTYTYKPLVGITSITQPNGQKETYEYDEFNRLKTVRDHKGKVLKQYTYHYRNSNR